MLQIPKVKVLIMQKETIQSNVYNCIKKYWEICIDSK